MGKVVTIANQKGGVAKTTTVLNLATILAEERQRVLIIDFDPQGSATTALGYYDADDMTDTISSVLRNVMDGVSVRPEYGILSHSEGFDVLPANYSFAGTEMRLMNAISRERVLRTYINGIRGNYDYILIDSNPALGLLTLNALTAADEVIIPLEPLPLSCKPLSATLDTIETVQNLLNPQLVTKGVLFTKVDHTKNMYDTKKEIRGYCHKLGIPVLQTEIPRATDVAATRQEGSTLCHCKPRHKAAQAYGHFAKEVTGIGWSRLSFPPVQAEIRR